MSATAPSTEPLTDTSGAYRHRNGTVITRHPNGTVTAGYTGDGTSITIAAGPGCSPTQLRLAFNAIKHELMPGGRREADHA